MLLLLAASGCDLVLGLERATPPAPCGPYVAPTQVVFDPRLIAPHDLSFDASGTRGLVHAQYTGASGVPRTGVHAVMLDGTGTWVVDAVRDRPVLDSFDGAHEVYDGSAFGWIDARATTQPSLYQYLFSTTSNMWGQKAGQIETDLTTSAHVGNAIEVPFGPAVLKFLVELKVRDAPLVSELRIRQQQPGRDWELTGQAEPLGLATPVIAPTGGALTMDHAILLYAATVGKATAGRIYASARTKRDAFEPGVEVTIEDVPSDADLSEPWIDATCTNLAFRWEGATWMTTAVDDASSRK